MMNIDVYRESIETYTGQIVRPLLMRLRDLDIRDIAHALSMKCRYTGHCQSYFSVAQHSVQMSIFALPGTAEWRLMHDVGEAYLPDIASPIKHRFPLIVEAEKHILNLVREKWSLPPYDFDEVHKADVAMGRWEAHNLMKRVAGFEWFSHFNPLDGTPLMSWYPGLAEHMFLERAERLGIHA